MKKALLIIFILSIIFLAGCGIFNLNYFVMPDDAEFLALITGLDTPEKICRYMQENFAWEYHFSNYSPYQLWLANTKTKAGDCNDFACFGVFVAHWHGYETYQITIKLKGQNIGHALAVYVEDNKYTYSTNEFYCPIFADSFKEIIIDCGAENLYSSYKVYDYAMKVVEMESIK